jgi:hypothetical protein
MINMGIGNDVARGREFGVVRADWGADDKDSECNGLFSTVEAIRKSRERFPSPSPVGPAYVTMRTLTFLLAFTASRPTFFSALVVTSGCPGW